MFETSKDILFWALAGSAVIFTFFLCWALFYIVMMLKRAHEAIKQVSDLIVSIKEKIDKLEALFSSIEEKLNHTASYLPLVFKGITELIDYFKDKKQKKASRSSSKK